MFIVMSVYSYCMFIYLHRANWHSSAILTEVFPCFFLSWKANAKVKLAKTGHGPHSSTFCVLFYVLLVCKCVLYYCHWVATQLQFNKYIIYGYMFTILQNNISVCSVSQIVDLRYK